MINPLWDVLGLLGKWKWEFGGPVGLQVKLALVVLLVIISNQKQFQNWRMQNENEKNFIKQQRNDNEKSLHFEVLS